MTTQPITRGSDEDRKAYAWATSNQGFVGSWEDWQAMDLSEREEYESGAAGGDEARQVVPPKIVRVTYWRGTLQLEDLAASYAEATEIASRNQNAYPAKFYDLATGEQLYDDGNGLRGEESSVYTC